MVGDKINNDLEVAHPHSGYSTLWAEVTFRCGSWCAKSSQIRPEIWTNKLKNGFFPVLDRFRALRESCVADQSCRIFLFPRYPRHLMRNLAINFACESCDEFRACTIENWTVVSRDYFLHVSSHSENVVSAGRVTLFLVELEFGHVSFWGEDLTRIPREKPLKARKRTNNKLYPSMHTCQLSRIIQ